MPFLENCEDTHGLGTLTFVIGGIDYEIPSHHFMQMFADLFEEGDRVCIDTVQGF